MYVVLKETEDEDYYEVKQERRLKSEDCSATVFDGFKIILYLCIRHDNEFKYLVRGSELQISKRQDLCWPEIP